jgi:hypothetical protein
VRKRHIGGKVGVPRNDVTRYRSVLSAAPDYDQPHDRNAWVHFRMGDYRAVRTQIDNDALIPFHSWLGKTHTFCDHHFALGSNSTSGHLLAIGGQSPTLKNPPFGAGGPQWDMPSIFVHAEKAGVTWAAFPDQDGYPTKFYTELHTAARSAKVHPVTPGGADPFVTMASNGTLPQLVYAWSPSGYDEHPPSASLTRSTCAAATTSCGDESTPSSRRGCGRPPRSS